MKKLLLLPFLFIYVTFISQVTFTQFGPDIDGEAAGDRSGQSAGHVRIYEWDGTAWTQLGTDIDGEAADDRSGKTVSMNTAGDRGATGAK